MLRKQLGGPWEGRLADQDNLRPGELVCGQQTPRASGAPFLCTREAHDARAPHMAGIGPEIIAIWWDGDDSHV